MQTRRLSILGVAAAPAALLLLVVACGHGQSAASNAARTAATSSESSAGSNTGSAVAAQPAAAGAPRAAATAAATAAAAAAPGGSSAAATDATAGGAASLDRKIVRNADLGLVVKDAGDAAAAVSGIATGLGGYVAASDLALNGDQLRGSLTVRVPADRFDDAMTQFRKLGVRVQRENISSQDVTQEYADLDARVQNLQATQEQLRLLVATVREKSNSSQDILNVYRELTTINGQIEQAKGRQQYLDKLSTLATIAVQLIPEIVVAPPPPAPPAHAWSPSRTFADAVSVLAGLGRHTVEGLIWTLVLLVPVAAAAAIAGGIVLVMRRAALRRRALP